MRKNHRFRVLARKPLATLEEQTLSLVREYGKQERGEVQIYFKEDEMETIAKAMEHYNKRGRDLEERKLLRQAAGLEFWGDGKL